MQHLKNAGAHELEGEDGSALLGQAVAVGGHGAGGDPPHIRVVAAGSHKEADLPSIEHRRYDGDVREVGTPGQLWVVGCQHIPWL